MKISMLLILFSTLQVTAGTASGQTITLHVRNAPLNDVFQSITKQTGYHFIYASDQLQNARPVTLDVKEKSLDETLRLCLAHQSLACSIHPDQKQVVLVTIAPASDKANVIPPPPHAPIDTIHIINGFIVNEDGQPLEGASIQLKGTGRVTAADARGKFSLSGKEPTWLIVSCIGYETKEFPTSANAPMFLQLKKKIGQLDETVIKGYYSTTNRLNTGNVSVVKSEDIQNQHLSDPIMALEGQVPGLFVAQTSGVPGSSMTIQLRGLNSIASGTEPFYIVDGVPFISITMTNNNIGAGPVTGLSPFNLLNPNDIESIEVLKDADATAIYGSRGANGVILITTKKGKEGKTGLNINISHGISTIDHSTPLLNTQQYLQMRHEAFNNDGQTPQVSDYDINGTWDTTRYTNWQKVLIGNTATNTTVNASLSGGNSGTQFSINGTYANQSTVYPGSFSDQKVSANLSITHRSTDNKLNAAVTAFYLKDNDKLPASDLASQILLAPDAPTLYNKDGSLNWENGTWNNPYAVLNEQATSTTSNLLANLNLSYEIIPGLRIKGNLGFKSIELNQTTIYPLSAYPPAYSTFNNMRNNLFATDKINSWIAEPQLTYSRPIGKGQLDYLLGSTFHQDNSSAISQIAAGYTSDAQIPNIAEATYVFVIGNQVTQYNYAALFTRLSYTYQDKYLLNATARRDGSSRFGPDKQFGNFGALGVGWLFFKEKFIATSLPFLSFGKIRGSYGITGNDQIGDYKYLSTYSAFTYPYQGQATIIPTSIANPSFSWELVRKLEFGLELGFIHDRILLTSSYYHNRTGNQLVGYSLPSTTGFTSVEANLPAVVQNTGVEFQLNTINIRTHEITWTTSVNLSIPRNKLVSYPNLAGSSYAYRYQVGKSLFVQPLFHYLDVNSSTGAYEFSSSNGPTSTPSSPQDYQFLAEKTQRWYGGMKNSVRYHGLQLDVYLQFVKQSGDYFPFVSGIEPGILGYGGISNQSTAVLNRWQNSKQTAAFQMFSQNYGSTATTAYFNATQSDRTISNASFVRLRNVSLSYTFPTTIDRRIHFQVLRIFLSGQNLLTITKYIGLDPETQGLTLPPLRTVTFGLQFTL
ncbi:TonB-linked SusC/RagA family outer membrane protein [Dinghuibacter silviterrae]|uniref:TonB-linked SusC/RagA family outer membrane protein n=2 Tax=Dinghuibacter silviterrae TaxID=1539049 RepID=A0A4R8DRP5_9BACT|nr:TonB-linked SusC/RagA family outer membrane protein [Dinghuibacter silviterrae]